MDLEPGAREAALTKMHGAHNEFLLLDERVPLFDAAEYPRLARRWCAHGDLHADGLLVIGEAASPAVARMRVFNSDGSEAEMCGNGLRCAARFLAERGAGPAFTIATLAGPIAAEIAAEAPEYLVRADIGPVAFPDAGEAREIDAGGRTWRYIAASLGNPHIVIVVDDARSIDLERDGALLAAHPLFPEGTNVHFMQLLGGDAIAVRHYERGVGITQACGTGAAASAAVARIAHGYGSPVTVHVPGGRLTVEWEPGGTAAMTGPAETMFARTVRA